MFPALTGGCFITISGTLARKFPNGEVRAARYCESLETVSHNELRILYVEDNADDSEVFRCAILRTCPGCRLEVADRPEQALQLLKSEITPPHIIITDSSFAGQLSGPEFIAELRRLYFAYDLPSPEAVVTHTPKPPAAVSANTSRGTLRQG